MTDKLSNLPHILWINLDRSADRREYMTKELTTRNLSNTRISGIDGQLLDIPVHNARKSEIGCTMSHLKAIQFFAESDLGKYCIIAEDDLSFEYVEYWKKDFNSYVSDTPNDFEVIQLAQTIWTHSRPITLKTVKYNKEYGTIAYLLTKSAAIKLSQMNFGGDLPPSDSLLYYYLNAYTVPLFTINTSFVSTIHPGHDTGNTNSKLNITNAWKQDI
jgi:GR25 family glycosyltransferase involved in LPS biosynthesis